MDNPSNKKSEPSVGAPRPPSGTNRTMTAIIAVLIVIIVVMSVLYLTKSGTPSAPTATQSVSGSTSATVGVPYNYTVDVGTTFKSVQVNFGDGGSVTVPYGGSQNVTVSHTYQNPGQAIISYSVTYSNGATATASKKLFPLDVMPSATSVSDQQSLGVMNVNYTASSPSLAGSEPVFKEGSFVNLTVGYFGEPRDGNYQVVWQNISVSYGTGKPHTISYQWDSGAGMYVPPAASPNLNFTFNQSGVYSVTVTTYTEQVTNTTTGALTSPLYSTVYFFDIAIFNDGAVYSQGTGGTFTYVTTTPYDTLDPAICYGVNGYQITLSTYETLVTWNGSSSTQFEPQLASALPTIANGGVNNNYANYTKSYKNGTGQTVSYDVNITPGENYTFHIRSNASWQDGSPVTAWDVMYSITRSLLFDAGSPGTPGWITAQYLLPGDYYTSNTFYNITQNITVDNSSNSITFHFQVPMAPSLVYNLFAAIGSQVASANWLEAHGAGITWNSTGFQDYKRFGLVANYNTYVENHAMSNGPFEVSYIVPSSEVVLIPNPFFNSPGPWNPKPTVSKVVLIYTSEVASMQLMMQSGQATAAAIPTANWGGVQNLQAHNKASVYNFTMLGVYYYSFNMHVNMTGLNVYTSQTPNMPADLFTNLSVRKVFSYAYDYNYFLDQQVGNAIYHTDFADKYAGMLARGMLGYQSIADLNQTTGNNVPYFNLQQAKAMWNNFVNNSLFNRVGNVAAGAKLIQWSGSAFTYNGKPLYIPVAIFSGLPSVVAGEATWESMLQQVIIGGHFPSLVMSANTIVNLAGHDSNPWPIWFATWFPDYPYPSDYLGPMAEPLNNTFIPGPNSFNPWFLNHTGHTDQANNATQMINWFNNGSLATDVNVALMNFHKMNNMLVNMTTMVYLEQLNGFWIMNPSVNGTYVQQYQSNLMFSSGGDLLFNLLKFD